MILIIWETPIAVLLAIWLLWDKLVENNMLIPMLISTPIAMFLTYLIYIKGIEDEWLFKHKLFED